MRSTLISAALTAVTLLATTLLVAQTPRSPESEEQVSRTSDHYLVPVAPTPREASQDERNLLRIAAQADPPEQPDVEDESAAPLGTGRPNGVPVGDELVFEADYETGDLSQWGTCQSVVLNSSCAGYQNSHYSMDVVPDPHGLLGYTARFEVRGGDVPEFGGGERSEVSSDEAASTRSGDERWYEWSMLLPSDFSIPTEGWFIVMQWHGGSGSPPLAVNISNEGTVDVLWNGEQSSARSLGPVRRGEWVSYTMHVLFSGDDTGFVEAWENGEQTVRRTHRATMKSDENYLKQGIYRDNQDATHAVTFGGLRVTAP